MRILLISPADHVSLISFSGVSDDKTPVMPELALPTLKALAPPDVEIRIVDEPIEDIDYDTRWDVVGITGCVNHRARICTIADEFRRRDQLVAIGGPDASLAPGEVRAHADILFVGEAETTWPRRYHAVFALGSAWGQVVCQAIAEAVRWIVADRTLAGVLAAIALGSLRVSLVTGIGPALSVARRVPSGGVIGSWAGTDGVVAGGQASRRACSAAKGTRSAG